MIRNGSSQSGKGGPRITRGCGRLARAPIALCVGLILAVASPARTQPLPQHPLRVVSLSLCADQLVLALADPGQIAALSPDATDSRLSYQAAEASRFPQQINGVEAIVAIDPDIVFADAGSTRPPVERLARLGYPIVYLDPVATIDDAIAQVEQVAALLDQEAAGETLVQTIEIARRQASRSDRDDTAISFRGNGEVPGEDSLMNDLLRTVGLTNVGDALSAGDGHVPLEVLVASPPDYLIVPEALPIAEREMNVIDHPALEQVFPLALRLEVADNLTICGGPSLPEALRRLSSELGRVSR